VARRICPSIRHRSFADDQTPLTSTTCCRFVVQQIHQRRTFATKPQYASRHVKMLESLIVVRQRIHNKIEEVEFGPIQRGNYAAVPDPPIAFIAILITQQRRTTVSRTDSRRPLRVHRFLPDLCQIYSLHCCEPPCMNCLLKVCAVPVHRQFGSATSKLFASGNDAQKGSARSQCGGVATF